MPESTDLSKDYKKTYDDFWKNIVETDGKLDLDKVQRELHDFHALMHNAGEVYCHVTGNRISKLNTDAQAVIAVADDILVQRIQEGIQDGQVRLTDIARFDRSVESSTPSGSWICIHDLPSGLGNLKGMRARLFANRSYEFTIHEARNQTVTEEGERAAWHFGSVEVFVPSRKTHTTPDE